MNTAPEVRQAIREHAPEIHERIDDVRALAERLGDRIGGVAFQVGDRRWVWRRSQGVDPPRQA